MKPCGHPKAARKIEVYAVGPRAEDRRIRTVCWACQVRDSTRDADRKEGETP